MALITKQTVDISTQTSSVEAAWYEKNGQLRKILVPRSAIVNTRKIVDLSDLRLPVASSNAGLLSEYLHHFLMENSDALPTEHTSSTLGWLPSKRDQFLTGETLIPSNPNTIEFLPPDAGDVEIGASMTLRGTIQGWQTAIKPIEIYPKVVATLYAALAAPLVRITGKPNFGIDLNGQTSLGKTTTQRAAASVWGYPDERSPNGFLTGWWATPVSLERRAAILNGLPLILDESSTIRDSRVVDNLIYMLINGVGKGRGSRLGTAKTGRWTTILISSGEAPLTMIGNPRQGKDARILLFRGAPFHTNTDPAVLKLVETLNKQVKLHCGHAGPTFVQWLLEHKNRWSDFQAEHQRIANSYPSTISGPAARLADSAALISLAGKLACEAGIIPFEFTDPFKHIWPQIEHDLSETDTARRSLRDVYDWCLSNQAGFIRDGKNETLPPKIYGRWDPRAYESIDIIGSVFRDDILSRFGHNADAVLEAWKDKDWLNVGPGRRHDKTIRFGEAGRAPGISIKKNAVDTLTNEVTAIRAPQWQAECRSCPAHENGWCKALPAPHITTYLAECPGLDGNWLNHGAESSVEQTVERNPTKAIDLSMFDEMWEEVIPLGPCPGGESETTQGPYCSWWSELCWDLPDCHRL